MRVTRVRVGVAAFIVGALTAGGIAWALPPLLTQTHGVVQACVSTRDRVLRVPAGARTAAKAARRP